MKVKKYNKKYQEFDKSKIEESIRLASKDAKEEIPEFMVKRIAQTIEEELINREIQSVDADELAKLVENKLMSSSYKDTAWHYITFHYERQKEHVYNSDLIKAFKKKLSGASIENSNANCDERSFSGKMNEAAKVLFKDDALNTMSKTSRNNHNNNEIYTHDLDSYSSGQHNCFRSDTKFVTDKGIMTFQNFTDGEPVTVLGKDGNWHKATVRNYGHKKTQLVELEYSGGGTITQVYCTLDHRWYLKDGTVTTDLKVGDILYNTPNNQLENPIIETKEDAEMWCLGFILGDGCDHYDKTQVQLCGDKNKYLPIFEQAFYKINHSNDNIICVKQLVVQKQAFLTNKMWKLLSFKQKQLLFMGYLSADGSKNSDNRYYGCSTSDERILEMVSDISCVCGYHILNVKHITHDTNYKKNAQLWNIRFITNQNKPYFWVVKSITMGTHNNDSVWCVEEPETTSFTLANGIVTGNCLSIPFDPLLKNGVVTKQTDIRQPKSILTACQLFAVLIQIQSLQQFGGVSSTHIDWTLVPYVRNSFFKHLRDGYKYILNKPFIIPDNCQEISIDDYKDDPIYQYAYDMTVRDAKQGAEGLIHNLSN